MERNTSIFRLTYIGHSGFCLQHDSLSLIFDYYTDEAGVIGDIIKDSDKVLVFVSHFHKDHFNPVIFDWLKLNPNISYIVSADVVKHNRNMKFPDSMSILRPGESLAIDNLLVRAFPSTDVGCSFAVEVDGKQIFHAGDLNNWHWMDESTEQEVKKATGDYLAALKVIADYYKSFDLVMFPVDARIGSNYYLGAKQFLERFTVLYFVPMHFWQFAAQASDFKLYATPNCNNYVCLTTPGDCRELNL